MNLQDGYFLPTPPTDTISSISFSKQNPSSESTQGNYLLITSWDGSCSVYDPNIVSTASKENANANANINTYTLHQNTSLISRYQDISPLLDGCFSAEDAVVYTAGLDGQILKIDFSYPSHNLGYCSNIGQHLSAVSCIEYDSQHNIVLSTSWDGTLQTWDERISLSNNNTTQMNINVNFGSESYINIRDSSTNSDFNTINTTPLSRFVFPDGSKGITADINSSSNTFIVATSHSQIYTFDTRDLTRPVTVESSPVSNDMRKISISSDGSCYAVSSIESRVGVVPFNRQSIMNGTTENISNRNNTTNTNIYPSLTSTFAFKCHRQTLKDGVTTFYPVTGLSFHPTVNTLLTSGSDGTCAIWDIQSKSRVSSITDLSSKLQAHLLREVNSSGSSSGGSTNSNTNNKPRSTKANASIIDSDISADGSLFAIAFSYGWEFGDLDFDSGAKNTNNGDDNNIIGDANSFIIHQNYGTYDDTWMKQIQNEVQTIQMEKPSTNIGVYIRHCSKNLFGPKVKK